MCFANDLILSPCSIPSQALYQRSIAKIWMIILLKQPHLHARVHSDGSGAQRDAERARLYCVIVVRCYPAVALRFSKQINMREAVILQRGGKQTQQLSAAALIIPLQCDRVGFNLFTLSLLLRSLDWISIKQYRSYVLNGHVRWR